MKTNLIKLFIFILTGLMISCGKENTPEDTNSNFSDDFSAYTVSNPWTLTGGWHYSNGSWGNNVQIVDNSGNKALRVTNNGWSLVYNDFSSGGYTLSAKIKPFTNVNNKPDFCGIVSQFNHSGANENSYAVVLNSTGSVVLYKNIAGTGYNLDSNTIPFASKWYTFTLEVKGGQIKGSVTDGTNTVNLSYTDSSPLPDGKIGLYFNWDSTHFPDTEFDDVKAVK